MPTYKLLIQRFPYGGREDSECVDWLMATYHKARSDPRFSVVRSPRLNDTPITMTRNAALVNARKAGFDFMFMVDSDMAPDVELLAGDRTARPFYDVAVETLVGRAKPAVIAAPYVGPPPHENVYVFQWANRGGTLDPEAANARLPQFTREHAAMMKGVQPVGALPTGLMFIDLRAIDKLPHPYTYYEYKDAGRSECEKCGHRERGPEAEKSSTEDVTFTRDLGLLGIDILCAWDSWAGHNKRYTARKPRPYTVDVVGEKMRAALARGVHAGESEEIVEEPDWVAERERAQAAELDRLVATRGNNGFNVTIDREAFLRPEPGTVPAPSPLDQTAQVVFDGQVMNQVAASGQPWLEFMPPPDPSPQPPPLAPVTPGDLLATVPMG